MKSYTCLLNNCFEIENYTLIPIRDIDKFSIMEWRNAQIDILRQKQPLTKISQQDYFDNVVNSLFEKDKPDQILWSFLLNNELIGYGGLVHIDWESKNAEISFVLCNERNNNIELFKKDWSNYLDIVVKIAQKELYFNKIYTYAYDIRDYYFEILHKKDFELEARLKKHIFTKGDLYDVLIVSKIF
jgi:hypothetical protein